MGDFQRVSELLETYAAKLPDRQFGPDGQELPSSLIRRVVAADAERRKAEALDPSLRAASLKAQAAREAADRQRESAQLESAYHAATPQKLAAMGLEGQEACVLASLEERAGVRAAKAWWGSQALFLVLGGKAGTGKTIAAASVLIPAATRRLAYHASGGVVSGPRWETAVARFAKAQELARMSLYGEESQRKLERLKLVGLLVLDDLGAEAKADGWTSLVDELIDARARHQVRTAITTNLSSSQLLERYGARVFRRLKDFGQFVAVDGPRKAEAA